MVYNPESIEISLKLSPGIVEPGKIVAVDDGKVKDFLANPDHEKWQKNKDSPAINVTVECDHNGIKYQDSKMFLYTEKNGKTMFTENSNLGKFTAYYEGKAPKVGNLAQMKTNKDGYFRLVIE